MRNIVAVLALAFACAAAQPCQAQTNIAYGPTPGQKLDICRPPAAGRPAPAVLMIHGGGWRNGSRTGLANICRLLAATGVVAIPVDYTLLTAEPETKSPIQINDVQLAMRWVRAHAVELGIDPNRICAEGDSAGGHLALMLDVLPNIVAGPAQDALRGFSPRANCVISISGIADLLSIETAHPGYANFFVGPGDAAFQHARKADESPALHVAPGDGPALLIHGLDDPAVPFVQAEEMQQALTRVGTPAWLISHPGGHEFKGMTNEQGHAAWALIGRFVQSHRLQGAPGVATADDVLR
jgi:acetyl esterase/lipase